METKQKSWLDKKIAFREIVLAMIFALLVFVFGFLIWILLLLLYGVT